MASPKNKVPPWEDYTQVAPIVGPISRVYPTLSPDEQKALDIIFRDPETTKKALKSMVYGSDHLPRLKDIDPKPGWRLAEDVYRMFKNFLDATRELTPQEQETLRTSLSDRKSAQETVRRLAKMVLEK